MTIWQAVVLGLVQGLGEFLPISSSAHLVLVPWLLGWHDPGLSFDVALHLGTLVAVAAYFWRDWLLLLSGAFSGFSSFQGRLFWYLVLACIPGAVIGYLLEDLVETTFRQPVLIALLLMIMGLVLYQADRFGRKQTEIEQISLRQSLLIGFSQALAVLPGVSRSGITMATGLFSGLSREAAARFSFLLSAPIILGAGLVKLPRLLAQPGAVDLAFLVGIGTAAVSGFLSIGFLLRYLRSGSFLPFAGYRLLLGSLVLLVWFSRSQ